MRILEYLKTEFIYSFENQVRFIDDVGTINRYIQMPTLEYHSRQGFNFDLKCRDGSRFIALLTMCINNDAAGRITLYLLIDTFDRGRELSAILDNCESHLRLDKVDIETAIVLTKDSLEFKPKESKNEKFYKLYIKEDFCQPCTDSNGRYLDVSISSQTPHDLRWWREFKTMNLNNYTPNVRGFIKKFIKSPLAICQVRADIFFIKDRIFLTSSEQDFLFGKAMDLAYSTEEPTVNGLEAEEYLNEKITLEEEAGQLWMSNLVPSDRYIYRIYIAGCDDSSYTSRRYLTKEEVSKWRKTLNYLANNETLGLVLCNGFEFTN